MKKPQQEYINLVGQILTDELLLHPQGGFSFNVQDAISEEGADATATDIHDFINGLRDALDFFENVAKSREAARIFKNPEKASDLLLEELLKNNPTGKPSAQLPEEARVRQNALSVLVSFDLDAAGANQETILEKIRELKDRVMCAAAHGAADYHMSENALLMKLYQGQQTIIAGQVKAAAEQADIKTGQEEIKREVKAGNKVAATTRKPKRLTKEQADLAISDIDAAGLWDVRKSRKNKVQTLRRWINGEGAPKGFVHPLSPQWEPFINAEKSAGDMKIKMRNHMGLATNATEASNIKAQGGFSRGRQPKGVFG